MRNTNHVFQSQNEHRHIHVLTIGKFVTMIMRIIDLDKIWIWINNIDYHMIYRDATRYMNSTNIARFAIFMFIDHGLIVVSVSYQIQNMRIKGLVFSRPWQTNLLYIVFWCQR